MMPCGFALIFNASECMQFVWLLRSQPLENVMHLGLTQKSMHAWRAARPRAENKNVSQSHIKHIAE